jgi:hypothetical protein
LDAGKQQTFPLIESSSLEWPILVAGFCKAQAVRIAVTSIRAQLEERKLKQRCRANAECL